MSDNIARLIDQLKKKGTHSGIIKVVGATPIDNGPAYQQDKYFMWLFAITEPDLIGTIDIATHEANLFTSRSTPTDKTFNGLSKYPVWSNQLIETIPFSSNVIPIIDDLRKVKTPREIELIRKACDITSRGHYIAMRICKPGLFEYQLDAAFRYYAHNRHNVRTLAYDSIVASGSNAITLHYNDNSVELINGNLVLCDMAIKYNSYAADVTRTWPINGKFTDEQRAIYQKVLTAQKAVIAAIRPGVKWSELEKINNSIIGNYSMPHGLGHFIGLDVHDTQRPDADTVLVPFMCIAIEPGIYSNGIGIRIEDNVLVTSTGCEVLTTAPKEISELESIIGSAWVKN